jgi:hypothetical protein
MLSTVRRDFGLALTICIWIHLSFGIGTIGIGNVCDQLLL